MIVVLLYFLALLTAVISATSSVAVVQPLNNQLPLIARVNQSYSWAFSPLTFSSSDGALGYTTSLLPAWLSFDASTQTFHGTPSSNDEGNPEITVTAHASGSSTSSKFTLCVTHYPPPTLNISLSDQFNDHNPSISSVYLPRPNSAIMTTNPTLRVPREWSFSIGFEGNTFVSQNNLFYELRLANGSDAPDYMNFNSKTITLDGVVPSGDKMAPPLTLPFLLYASDQEGYSAATLPFTIVVADHELAEVNETLPEINITTSNQFSISLLSPADFTGIIVDGDPIQPSNISTLDIDVSGHDWLKYDPPSRTLSGKPGVNTTGSRPSLPVNLTTIFGQSIRTNVTLALVPSYFVLPELPSLHFSKGDAMQFNLGQWFSNSTGDKRREDASITVAFSDNEVANWMRFNESSTELTGTVPLDYDSNEDYFTVTFTAYSQVTHSTSHTSFALYVAGTGLHKSLAPEEPNGLSKAAHRRLVLVLVITFGLVGGLCLICGFFAIFRRCARVEDTAMLGEEGRHAWSEKDRRWYGVTLSPRGTRIIEKTGRSLNPSPNQLSSSRLPQGRLPNYGNPGLGLRRVSERSQSIADDQSTGIMSKREFMSRIKETVRQVSDKYSKNLKQRRLSYDRPVIGKPILIPPLRPNQTEPAIYVSPSNPFDDIQSLPGSTFIGSPSTSTAEHSIPRRRADFAPPRNLAQVHFEDPRIVRQLSTASLGANSLRSASGRSRLSRESSMEVSMGPPSRPRLVPFTSSTRVPVPQTLVSSSVPDGNFIGNRIASQKAKLFKVDSQNNNLVIEGGIMKPSATNDELTMGIHYVRSLGADQLAVDGSGTGPKSSPTPSNGRSSFTSLESSHVGHKSGTGADMMRVLVRVGEKFKFRVPIPESYRQRRGYHVKTATGQPIPKFLQADPTCINSKGVLELSGVASFRDLGEMIVGIYGERDGVCVATVVIEVVSQR